MNIGDVKVKINKSLRSVRLNTGILNPSDISADIIVNAAFDILRVIYAKNVSLKNIDSSEISEVRSILTREIRLDAQKTEYCKEIAENYCQASKLVVVGLDEDDIEYLRNEIYELVKHPISEEVITNYYLAKHKFNPFKEIQNEI